MIAKSIKGRSTEEIKKGLQHSISDGFKPTLALVFLSAMNEIEAVCSLLDKDGIAIFGATTFAEFTEQDAENAGIAVLLLDINPAYFKIVFKENEEGSGYQMGCHIGETGIKAFVNPAFIISTANYKTPGDPIIQGMVEKAGADVTIVGGKAGEMVDMEGKVFTNTQSSGNAIISLILDQEKITRASASGISFSFTSSELLITISITSKSGGMEKRNKEPSGTSSAIMTEFSSVFANKMGSINGLPPPR